MPHSSVPLRPEARARSGAQHARRAVATRSSSGDKQEELGENVGQQILALLRKQAVDSNKQAVDSNKKLEHLQKQINRLVNSNGMLLELSCKRGLSQFGVRGGSFRLVGVQDALSVVLPSSFVQLLHKPGGSTFYMHTLLDHLKKDHAYLTAVHVLLKKRKRHEEAEVVRALIDKGAQLENDADVQTVRHALTAALRGKGYNKDIIKLRDYLDCKADQRDKYLLEQLYVPCVVAVLEGACTSEVEVDAGGEGGCAVNTSTGALQLRFAEVKTNPSARVRAQKQLKRLFGVVSYTLDKVLAALEQPGVEAEYPALAMLPRRLLVDGYCVHLLDASEQQRHNTASRCEAPKAALKAQGLVEATLVTHVLDARRTLQ